MGIALETRPRQQRCIVERGMVELIRQHQIVAPHERRHDAEIGHVAGGKGERRFLLHERGELLLQLLMRRAVADHQM